RFEVVAAGDHGVGFLGQLLGRLLLRRLGLGRRRRRRRVWLGAGVGARAGPEDEIAATEREVGGQGPLAPLPQLAHRAPRPAVEAGHHADGGLIGVLLGGLGAVGGGLALHGRRRGRAALLDDVRQLVREQRVADQGAGLVGAGGERDVAPDRERGRAEI